MTPLTRASETWVSGLSPCSISKYRTKLKAGGSPVFLLTPAATAELPEWWFLVKSRDGTLFRVISEKNPFCRRIDSLKVAYRMARMAGLQALNLPIDNTGKP